MCSRVCCNVKQVRGDDRCGVKTIKYDCHKLCRCQKKTSARLGRLCIAHCQVCLGSGKGKFFFFLLSSIFLNQRSGYGNIGCGKSRIGRVFYPERHLRFHKIGKTNVKMYFVNFYIVPTHRMV